MPRTHNTSKEEQEVINELCERIKSVFLHEKKSNAVVGALAKMYPDAVANVRKGNGTMVSLLKVMRVMGYEVAFIRSRKPFELFDDMDAVTRLSKLKKTSKNARIKQKAKKKIPSQSELREQYETNGRGGNFL